MSKKVERIPLLFGLGVSSKAMAKYLARSGSPFLFTQDALIPESLSLDFASLGGQQSSVDELRSKKLELVSQLVVSPGIPPSHPLIVDALMTGIPVTTELECAFPLIDPRTKIIGITGTNGKSTVCDMCSYLLSTWDPACPYYVSGNIGIPLIEAIGSENAMGGISLELSSYQLEYLNRFRVDIAIFTNLTSDHLARHGSMKDYLKAKLKLLDFIAPGGLIITSSNFLESVNHYKLPWNKNAKLAVIGTEETSRRRASLGNLDLQDYDYYSVSGSNLISEKTILAPLSLDHLAGSHNYQNAAMTLLAARHLGFEDIGAASKLLKHYKPLPFRCAKVENPLGIELINDSKSTNVASTCALLSGQKQEYILLLGGEPKGESFAQIAEFANSIKEVFAFGAAKEQIYHDLHEHLPVRTFDTCKKMLEELPVRLRSSPVNCFFSPACASFDEFSNYVERGTVFDEMMASGFRNVID